MSEDKVKAVIRCVVSDKVLEDNDVYLTSYGTFVSKTVVAELLLHPPMLELLVSNENIYNAVVVARKEVVSAAKGRRTGQVEGIEVGIKSLLAKLKGVVDLDPKLVAEVEKAGESVFQDVMKQLNPSATKEMVAEDVSEEVLKEETEAIEEE